MSELPPGWEVAKLSDIAQVIRGVTYQKSDAKNEPLKGYLPILRATNIAQTLLLTSEMVYVPARHVRDNQQLQDGDIIVATSSGSASVVGKSAQLRQPWSGGFGAFCSVIRHEPAINPRYLAHFVASSRVRRAWRDLAQGTNINNLKTSDLATTSVPVAPLAEQERIVAAIEEQFSRLDAGVAALERVRHNLKRMRAAVLQAATRGELVHHDPQDESLPATFARQSVTASSSPNQPANWMTTTIGSIAHVSSGATPSRSRKDYWQGGSIPWVTSTLLNKDYVVRALECVTPQALRETSIKLMPPGTLLVAMYGEGQTRGRCSELQIEATTNQACASIVLNKEMRFVKPYLKLALTASYEANRRLSIGGVQPNLSIGIIKDLKVALPPANEQKRILREASRQLDIIALMEERLEKESKLCRCLRSSVLSAAFAGKLVSQDSSDEPASVLLERIFADRASSNGQKPRKQRVQQEALL